MNETLKQAAKNILKGLLTQCTEEQQLLFKRMYSPNDLGLSVDEVVERMDERKLDWAITQCEKTLTGVAKVESVPKKAVFKCSCGGDGEGEHHPNCPRQEDDDFG